MALSYHLGKPAYRAAGCDTTYPVRSLVAVSVIPPISVFATTTCAFTSLFPGSYFVAVHIRRRRRLFPSRPSYVCPLVLSCPLAGSFRFAESMAYQVSASALGIRREGPAMWTCGTISTPTLNERLVGRDRTLGGPT